MIRITTAILLLVFVFFGSVPKINFAPIPNRLDEAISIVEINAPSDLVLEQVRPISDLVKDVEDRAKLALFNYEFANRVINYQADSQQINDVYTKAAQEFFKESLKDKYDDLPIEIEKLFSSVLTGDNHVLTDIEKQSLKTLFLGLSWSLLKKPT